MRGFALAVATAVSCAALAACTGDGESPGTPTPQTPPTATDADPVSLRFSVSGSDETVAAYREMTDAYLEQRSGVRITVEDLRDDAAVAESVLAETAEGATSDVFLLGADHLAQLVEAEALTPVGELLEERGLQFGDDYQRVGLNAFAADEDLQCMPAEVSPLVVYYNRELVRPARAAVEGESQPTPERGWRWAQFVRAAEQATAPGVRGVYLPPEVDALLPFIRSAGGDVVDAPVLPGRLTLGEGEAAEALLQLAALARSESAASQSEIAAEDAVTRFARGELAMMLGYRDLVPPLREVDGLRFDVFPVPSLGATRAVADIRGLCLFAGSEHSDEAADFVAWLVGPEATAVAARSGAIVPSALAAVFSADFVQPGRAPGNAEVFATVLRRADPAPYSPFWPEVEDRLGPVLSRVLYDDSLPLSDVEALLASVDERSAAWFAPPAPQESGTDPEMGE